LVLLLACFAGAMAARALWYWQSGTHVLVVAPPILLAALIVRPHRDWLGLSIGGFTGIALAWGVAGADWAVAWVLALGPLLAALMMASAPLSWPVSGGAPSDLWQGMAWLIGAGLLVPLFDASWQLAWSRHYGFAYFLGNGGGLLLAYVTGHLLLLPLLLGLARRSARTTEITPRRLAVSAALFLVPMLLWTVPALAEMPSALLTVATLPLLLWMLVEFGLAGVSTALVLLAVVGVRLSLAGSGPFSGLPVPAATLGLQTWICVTAAAMWLMAVLLEQRRAAARQLRDGQRQLVDLTGRVLVVQEEERTRIARELHDDINQQLAAVSIRLSYLKRSGTEAQRVEVAAIQQDLLRVSNDIRGMSHELHPAVLRFTGLTSALAGLCHNHSTRTTLRIECEVDTPEGLGSDQELGLFRIVQEAVNNVEKHARATRVWVRLEVQPAVCVLSITDDGKGMDVGGRRDGGRPRPGLGMISMEERARLLGGRLQVVSPPGGGTRVEVRFPRPGAPPA
jgi:two-component system sensor histidine kinase UhpB